MKNPSGLLQDTGGTANIPSLVKESIVSLLISIVAIKTTSMVLDVSPNNLLRLIIIFLVVLGIIHYSLRIIERSKKNAAKLVDIYIANTRAIYKNLENSRIILDKLVQNSYKVTELRALRNRLTSIISYAKNADLDKFGRQDATIEEFNAAEKLLVENSEKLVHELERQSNENVDVANIERSVDAVEEAVRGRIPLTNRLNDLYAESLKREQHEKSRIPETSTTDLTLYLNMLQAKYASNKPEALHTGDYLADARWDYHAGDNNITARVSNGFGTPLIIEARWQGNSKELVDMVQKEAESVKKNQYKCLCLVNTAWGRESRDFSARFNHPRLALYLYELSGELLYNRENHDAEHYGFWFNREQKKKTLIELAQEFARTHDYFTPHDLAGELGLNEEGAQKLLGGLEKKGLVTDVSFKSDKVRKYTKAKAEE